MLLRLGLHSAALLLLIIPILVCTAVGDNPTAALFSLLFLGYVATLRANPLPRIVERRIIKEAQCPYCGEVIDLVGTWSCGCGYLIWESRHAFSPCPHCKKVFTWLVCPRCEGSIPV